jgi:hypothetical protein
MLQCVVFYIVSGLGADPCSTLVREILNNTYSCLTDMSCLSVSVLLSLYLYISFHVINFLFCYFIGLFIGKIPDFIYLIAVSLYIIFICLSIQINVTMSFFEKSRYAFNSIINHRQRVLSAIYFTLSIFPSNFK